jgi:hypothetical protein
LGKRAGSAIFNRVKGIDATSIGSAAEIVARAYRPPQPLPPPRTEEERRAGERGAAAPRLAPRRLAAVAGPAAPYLAQAIAQEVLLLAARGTGAGGEERHGLGLYLRAQPDPRPAPGPQERLDISV